MSVRTSPEAVAAVMAPGEDYDGTSDLFPFINAASRRVDWCRANAADFGRTAMSTAEAVDVETFLAAGLYKMSDQQLASSNAGKSSGTFRGQSGKMSENNTYLERACMLDSSGVLKAALDNRIAGASWLGKPVSSQILYSDRD